MKKLDSFHATRRALLKAAPGALLAAALPELALAQQAQEKRRFEPQPGAWRTFEVTTAIKLQQTGSKSTVWVPLPSVDTDWQRSLSSSWSGNAKAMHVGTEPH